jgi:hypothetical protein
MICARFAKIVPSGVQVSGSLIRVAAFAWTVLEVGNWQNNQKILYFLGFIPFYALLDVIVQSWTRASLLNNAAWVAKISPLRRPFAGSALVMMGVLSMASQTMPLSMQWASIISAFCLFGSCGMIWERWLATPKRAILATIFEIMILFTTLLLYHHQLAGRSALLLCFVAYMFARLLALLIPGRSAGETAMPKATLSSFQYLFYAVSAQIAGATAASMPTIYALGSGSTESLSNDLALYRVMHSFAAIASFAVNAIGSRLFFGEAAFEMVMLEKIDAVVKRYRLLIDLIFASSLVVLHYTVGNSAYWAVPLFSVPILTIINLRSSIENNRGRPQNGFFLQISVALVSLLVLFILHDSTAMVWISFFGVLMFASYSEHLMKLGKKLS